MGLVETKLAIIPGGGMNCWLSSLVFDLALNWGTGQSPVRWEGSIWVKEADAAELCILQSCLACGGGLHLLAFCTIPWSVSVSLLARSP